MTTMGNLFERLNKKRPPPTEEATPPPTKEPKAVSLFERLDKGRLPATEGVINRLRGDSPIEKLLDWLANRWPKDTVTARQIYTLGPYCIRNSKAAVSLAQILVERGWLMPTETRQYNTHEWKVVRRTTSVSGAAGAALGR
jgi:hypothetical protein